MTTLHQNLDAALTALSHEGAGARVAADSYGNEYRWYPLISPEKLPQAAELLAAEGARLAMITACPQQHLVDPVGDVAYHFEVGGVVYTLIVTLAEENPSVVSITPVFRNADWHEREMRELFGVRVEGHPNPNRLFLNETLEEGIWSKPVPLSVMMNGACSRDLWEKILQSRNDERSAGSASA
jgi:NADH:ubiquinone oxidoreductase subunit C